MNPFLWRNHKCSNCKQPAWPGDPQYCIQVNTCLLEVLITCNELWNLGVQNSKLEPCGHLTPWQSLHKSLPCSSWCGEAPSGRLEACRLGWHQQAPQGSPAQRSPVPRQDMEWGGTEATPFSGTHDAFQTSLRKYPVSILRGWGRRGIVFDTPVTLKLLTLSTQAWEEWSRISNDLVWL